MTGPSTFYMFAIGADPASPASWTHGAVYALPRAGFRRDWGREWVSASVVRPVLRVPVGPEDFPPRDVVVAATPDQFRRILPHLRAAKRERPSSA